MFPIIAIIAVGIVIAMLWNHATTIKRIDTLDKILDDHQSCGGIHEPPKTPKPKDPPPAQTPAYPHDEKSTGKRCKNYGTGAEFCTTACALCKYHHAEIIIDAPADKTKPPETLSYFSIHCGSDTVFIPCDTKENK